MPGTTMVDGKHPDTESQFVRGPIVELNNAYHLGLDDADFGFALRFAIFAAGERGAGETAVLEGAGALAGLRRVSQVRRGKSTNLSAIRGSTSSASLAAKRATPHKLEWGESGRTYLLRLDQSRKLAIDSAGMTRSDAHGYVNHHIMPRELRDHPLLIETGFRFDQDATLLLLPKPGSGRRGGPFHDGSHPAYTRSLLRQLGNVDRSQPLGKKRIAVERIIQRARKGIESGIPVRNKDGATEEMWDKWYEANEQTILRNLLDLFRK